MLLRKILGEKNKHRVLICYITSPFLMDKVFHTNNQELRVLAQVLDYLEYDVDVVDHDSEDYIDYTQYDCIIGFGECFEKSFGCTNRNIKRIYYATGAHWAHQNKAEIKRVLEVNKRYESSLMPKRIINKIDIKGNSFSDYLVVSLKAMDNCAKVYS